MLSRLSGSTAEFLSIWNLMMSGHQPFLLLKERDLLRQNISAISRDEECAVLSLKPILPGWLFDRETKSITFTFLGAIQVTYRNPGLIDTWHGKSFTGVAISKDPSAKRYATLPLDAGGSVEYFDCHVSRLARDGKIKSIDLLIR
jgi:hypothetical protein